MDVLAAIELAAEMAVEMVGLFLPLREILPPAPCMAPCARAAQTWQFACVCHSRGPAGVSARPPPSARWAVLQGVQMVLLAACLLVPAAVQLPACGARWNWNNGQLIDAPEGDRDSWLSALRAHRRQCRQEGGLSPDGNDAIFSVPELRWTRSAYIQVQSHPYDLLFWDVRARNYTVGRWLDDLTQRYGGIDAVLLELCTPDSIGPYAVFFAKVATFCFKLVSQGAVSRLLQFKFGNSLPMLDDTLQIFCPPARRGALHYSHGASY